MLYRRRGDPTSVDDKSSRPDPLRRTFHRSDVPRSRRTDPGRVLDRRPHRHPPPSLWKGRGLSPHVCPPVTPSTRRQGDPGEETRVSGCPPFIVLLNVPCVGPKLTSYVMSVPPRDLTGETGGWVGVDETVRRSSVDFTVETVLRENRTRPGVTREKKVGTGPRESGKEE